MWGVTSFGDELTGDFCDGFEAISIGDFGLFYRLAGKIVSRILGLLQQYRLSAQPVDATQALNLSTGVSNPNVSRGRSLS
jgi:hypothetical protein